MVRVEINLESGIWKLENGKWKMENGKWKMETNNMNFCYNLILTPYILNLTTDLKKHKYLRLIK